MYFERPGLVNVNGPMLREIGQVGRKRRRKPLFGKIGQSKQILSKRSHFLVYGFYFIANPFTRTAQ
jgi:hypothetical protein